MTVDSNPPPQWSIPPEQPTLLTLPFELRQIILEYLFTPLVITPCISSSVPHDPKPAGGEITALSVSPAQTIHPSLAILTTCRLLHAEALLVIARQATLSLRTRTQSALLGKPTSRPNDFPPTCPPTNPAAPTTTLNTSHPTPRQPPLSSIRSLHLTWPLLPSYPSPVLLSIFTSLHSLRISAITVSVAHGVLLNLWRERWAQTGMLRPAAAADKETHVMGQGVQGEKRMLLLQALLCWLEAGECDVLLDVLGAARGRWRVEMGWRVGCASCKGGEEEGEEEAWEEGRRCGLGVLAVEVGVEL